MVTASIRPTEDKMTRPKIVVVILTVIVLSLSTAALAKGNSRLGGGVHYWKALDDVNLDKVDESGLSWLISYQFGASSIVKLQADLEVFPKGFAGLDEVSYAPQAFVIAGKAIYGGLGIGTYYADGKFGESAFYMLRAGVDLELLPTLFLDINGNYRFEDWKNLGDVVKDIDTDVVTLGAALRMAF
jgi:hypothetical protein